MLIKRAKCSHYFNPFTSKSDLIDFTLSNARRFYSSKGDPLGVKGLTQETGNCHESLCDFSIGFTSSLWDFKHDGFLKSPLTRLDCIT